MAKVELLRTDLTLLRMLLLDVTHESSLSRKLPHAWETLIDWSNLCHGSHLRKIFAARLLGLIGFLPWNKISLINRVLRQYYRVLNGRSSLSIISHLMKSVVLTLYKVLIVLRLVVLCV